MNYSPFITHCKLLVKQWRFSELEYKISNIARSNPDYCNAQYVLLHSLIIRGHFNEAKEVYNNAIPLLSYNEDLHTTFQLRYIVLEIQMNEVGDFNTALGRLKEWRSKNISLFNRALSFSLYGRAILLGISFGLLSSLEKPKALNEIEHAAELFRQAGHLNDHLNELLFLGDCYNNKPNANSLAASTIYQRVLTNQSRDVFVRLIVSEAKLALAQLHFDKDFETDLPRERVFEELIKPFETAIDSFKSAGYLLPYAIVKKGFGTVLLKYGIEEGLNYLDDAIDDYHQHGFFIEEQLLRKQIVGWHLSHGNFSKNKNASDYASTLNFGTGFNLPVIVSYLEQINDAFLTGRIDFARELYELASNRYENHPLQSQLDTLQANSLSNIGLRNESLQIFRRIAKRISHLEVSSFLSEAYANLATVLMHSDAFEAAVFIAQAINIDEQMEDNMAKIEHIHLFIMVLLRQQEVKGLPISFTSEVQTCLNECFNLLKNNKTHQGTILHAATLQTKAMILFRSGQLEEAIKIYEEAEPILRQGKINGSLYFLISHLALALVQKARNQKSIKIYEEAIAYFNSALTFFKNEGLTKEQHRLDGLIGICYLESGRLEVNADLAKKRWKNAEIYFEKSYELNRFLRTHSDNSTAISVQKSMIAIGGESQTYIEQAFYMNLQNTQNAFTALKWLERMKSQALLESLKQHEYTNEEPQAGINSVQYGYSISEEQISSTPDAGMLIVQYFYSNEKIYLYGIRADWSTPRLVSLPFNLNDLTDCIQMNFSTLYGNVRSMIRNGMEHQWQQFKFIIKPVEEWSVPGETICFIPHKILHQIPLHAFHTSESKYLIERNPVIYNHSLSLFNFLRKRNTKYPNSIRDNFVYGNSRNNLKFAALEAEEVASILGTKAILGDNVTRNSVLHNIPFAKILHISGHSELSDFGGWKYGLQMANNELLTSDEIFSSHTNADLVVLSGCETGMNEYNSGDELVGLVYSFMNAGAKNIIVSLWKIDDSATSEFFKDFYENLQKSSLEDIAKILQESICSQIMKGKNLFHWGAFQLIGR